MTTIKKKLEAERYPTVDAVQTDLLLMIKNCQTFNAPGTPVYISGEEVKMLISAGLVKIKSDSKGGSGGSGNGGIKRAGEKDKSSGMLKKQKLL